MPRPLQRVTLLLWLLALAGVSLLMYARPLRKKSRAWFGRLVPVRFRLDSPSGQLPVWAAIAL